MEKLKSAYDQVISERKELTEQINILADDETVKKYLELNRKNNKLANQERDLYKQIKVKEYLFCNHIWVTTSHEYDGCEGRSYNYRGCIKCGLDERMLLLSGSYLGLDLLTLDQRIMYDFLKNHSYGSGMDANLLCDLDLAKAIYSKITEAHPDIDDETASNYLKVALHNIRNIKVSEERKVSRVRRLSLHSKFDKWNGRDVCSY